MCTRLFLKKGITINQYRAKQNSDKIEGHITELLDTLALLLEEQPEGYSEHQLFKLLQNPPHIFFAKDALQDSLVLFKSHFLLFHCLYLLRNRWLKDNSALLEISALSIKKTPITIAAFKNTNTSSHVEIMQSDPLAQYYLDWAHFSNTTNEDVEEMLNSFWKKVWLPQPEEELQQALSIMEIEAPLPLPQLKQQYRRLAQRFHPDKGGDSTHFKKICQAFHQLRQYQNII